MLNVIKPSEEELLPLVTEALNGVEPDEFISQFVSTAAGLLERNPKRYRSYGMYWFAIKRLLIEHEFYEFGESVEAGFANGYTYPSALHTCCAAWAYRQHRIKTGLQFSSEHVAPMVDDPDYAYDLEDLEMEELILG